MRGRDDVVWGRPVVDGQSPQGNGIPGEHSGGLHRQRNRQALLRAETLGAADHNVRHFHIADDTPLVVPFLAGVVEPPRRARAFALESNLVLLILDADEFAGQRILVLPDLARDGKSCVPRDAFGSRKYAMVVQRTQPPHVM